MKKKLIAAVLAVAVIAGVGTVVYNTNNVSDNVKITENNCEVVTDKPLENKFKTVDSNETIDNREKTKNDSTNKASDVTKTANDKEAFTLNNDNNATSNKENTSTVDKPVIKPEESKPVVKPEVEKPVTPPVEQKPVTPPVEEKPVAPPVASGQFMSAVEQAIFNMVNQERAKAGVPALAYNNVMEKYARIKSQDMGDRNYFSHTNPEGENITAQMQRDGVSYNAWGENIAYLSGGLDANALASQFMNNWMNSDGHRKNILSTNFSGIGVGVYKAGNKVYATQEFYK